MEIISSVNERYLRKSFLGPLSIISFLVVVCQIYGASQPQDGHDFADDPNIIETYKAAVAEKREASSDLLKVEAKLELVKQKVQSFSDAELMTIKEINTLTSSLAQADSRAGRKRAKKDVLSAEKKLRGIVGKERTHKEKLMNVNDQVEKAKKRLETVTETINKIESYIEAI